MKISMRRITKQIKHQPKILILGAGLAMAVPFVGHKQPIKKDIFEKSRNKLPQNIAVRDNTLVKNKYSEFADINSLHPKDCLAKFNSFVEKKFNFYKKLYSYNSKDTFITTEYPGSVKAFNSHLNNAVSVMKKNSKLKNKGHVFINVGKKYNVNPVLIAAVAMEESARGTSNAAINKNNVGGIMGRRGLVKFKSVEDCIDSIAKTLSNRISDGHDTVEKIAYSGNYCNKSVASKWSKNVMHYVNKF